jgi:hypothetical protein
MTRPPVRGPNVGFRLPVPGNTATRVARWTIVDTEPNWAKRWAVPSAGVAPARSGDDGACRTHCRP